MCVCEIVGYKSLNTKDFDSDSSLLLCFAAQADQVEHAVFGPLKFPNYDVIPLHLTHGD